MQLADGLAKVGLERGYLLDTLETGQWSPTSTPAALEAKEQIRAGRHARAELRRQAREALGKRIREERGW